MLLLIYSSIGPLIFVVCTVVVTLVTCNSDKRSHTVTERMEGAGNEEGPSGTKNKFRQISSGSRKNAKPPPPHKPAKSGSKRMRLTGQTDKDQKASVRQKPPQQSATPIVAPNAPTGPAVRQIKSSDSKKRSMLKLPSMAPKLSGEKRLNATTLLGLKKSAEKGPKSVERKGHHEKKEGGSMVITPHRGSTEKRQSPGAHKDQSKVTSPNTAGANQTPIVGGQVVVAGVPPDPNNPIPPPQRKRKPQVFELNEKEKQIAKGASRAKSEYPTFDDVVSDWGDEDETALKDRLEREKLENAIGEKELKPDK